jgi:hypothetical protein
MTRLLLIAMLIATLAACGGGIDTPDEFMGPPTAEAKVPRPCPIDPASCHPGPS